MAEKPLAPAQGHALLKCGTVTLSPNLPVKVQSLQ